MTVHSQLVVVDVTVTDKHGKPVHGLKASDFALLESGKPQQVKNFEEHVAMSHEELAKVSPRPQLPPGDFTNFVTTPQSAALDIILIDRLNTAQKDQNYLQQQLLAYVKQARPDARIAVFGMMDHLVMLKGFDSDSEALLKALTLNGISKGSFLRDNTVGGMSEGLVETSPVELNPRALAAMRTFEAQYRTFDAEESGKYMLDALNQLGRAMINVPGRKNLIWFAGNFPPQFFPRNQDPAHPDAPIPNMQEEYQETINLLAKARIAIYPVDVQGVQTSHVNDATGHYPQYAHNEASRTGTAMNVDTADETSERVAEHTAMLDLARDSGGRAFLNTNDLTKATAEAVDSGSDFYTLAYTPDSANHKLGLRSIEVKVEGKPVTLSYRRGYYAEEPGDKTIEGLAVAEAKQQAQSPRILQALSMGGPEPTEVLLRVRAMPVTADEEAAVAEGNEANPKATRMAPPYRRYEVEVAASARNMRFSLGVDHLYHTSVDVVTCVYDDSGVLMNAQSNTIRTKYDAKGLMEVLRGGILLNQQVSVPISGHYSLRIAVADETSGHMGAVEVPVASIAKLSPLNPGKPDAVIATPESSK